MHYNHVVKDSKGNDVPLMTPYIDKYKAIGKLSLDLSPGDILSLNLLFNCDIPSKFVLTYLEHFSLLVGKRPQLNSIMRKFFLIARH